MKNAVEKYLECRYTNFYGSQQQLEAELAGPVLVRASKHGVCWISYRNDIYYLNYCLDDIAILTEFVDYGLNGVELEHGLLLELKYNDPSMLEGMVQLADSLSGRGFVKQSHHIAYLKDYLKNQGDNAAVFKIYPDKTEELCSFLKQIPVERLSLTADLVRTMAADPDYLLLGTPAGGTLSGYIILHGGKGTERTGFIRDVYIDRNLGEEEQYQTGSLLFNAALNAFADSGCDKAVFWNDINDLKTSLLLEKYGFSRYANEIIVYTCSPNLK